MSIQVSAANMGAYAAAKGKPYEDNPFCRTRTPELFLAWSKSHTAMRASLAKGRQEAAGPC